ncbi:hypothetical protein J5X98_22010 [Leptothermofonsia sichuanensis E412]|nr:hypothetical protein [Leptothermofonsia sichuanensis]QZZ19943.1 hypothetical protein J5X98_22010 [Leptothermofonsia sichuanensis E412]
MIDSNLWSETGDLEIGAYPIASQLGKAIYIFAGTKAFGKDLRHGC